MSEGTERKDATGHTRARQKEAHACLPWSDERDLEEAARGLIAPLPDGPVTGADGQFVYDPHRLSFIEGEAPDTVHPGLWRQSGLVARGGLFKVCERVYQVRNIDLSNLTIIEGETGLIIVDPLISAETARAALDLYFEHRPARPVVAVVHSHSHVDHYGGVRGVVDEEDVKAGRVRIIAPEGFLDAAVSENVVAGNAMSRRAMYQFGPLLAPDEKGTVGVGIGSAISLGTITLIPPTEEITSDGPVEIDGLTFDFMLTPDTEAPAEMHWYLPELKALTAAENCLHTLHNTYPIRGAQVRDPRAWSHYLNETLARWGGEAEVMYGMHHWPVWGGERIREMLSLGRDAYRYINDETLRLANHGLTPIEIAEEIRFPERLANHWAVREYYGTLSHNVKATYTRYLGWFDGNPARLHPLTPVESARRYVDYMGGANAVIERARDAFDAGEYRWVAQVLDHVVFAEPANREARELSADAMEQLAYQTESATWRNAYLTAAQELRFGTPEIPGMQESASPDSIKALPFPRMLDYLAVRLNGRDSEELDLTIHLKLRDSGDEATLRIVNGVLNHTPRPPDDTPDVTVTMDRATLDDIVSGVTESAAAVESGAVTADPDAGPWLAFMDRMDRFSPWFAVVEP